MCRGCGQVVAECIYCFGRQYVTGNPSGYVIMPTKEEHHNHHRKHKHKHSRGKGLSKEIDFSKEEKRGLNSNELEKIVYERRYEHDKKNKKH